MPFEYEALVGHLYVVDARAISAPPPGSLVEVAPKRVARGREADTFFTLVLPWGETIAPAAFYEQMAQLSAEQYFNTPGSVTAALRAAFSHLNENLFEHNEGGGKHYEASMICAVLRGADLYLAEGGPGAGLFRLRGDVQQFAADFSTDEALFGPPMGVQTVLDI
ncbi:MAG: hypothetical protein GYB67_12520 [Chloroflexi bacterium]|nr:hypothetical protein [Chloroflexota bacterium]